MPTATLIRELLACRDFGRAVSANGWIKTRRDAKGGFSFLELNDGSCLRNLQVIAPATLPNYANEVLALHPGAAVRVDGELRASPGAEQAVELHAATVHVYGMCDINVYPLQKKRISFERLRELAHLRARTNTFGAMARVRSALAFAVHRFFQERGYYFLQAPIITTSDCEGAGQMFQVSTLNLAELPRTGDGRVDYAQDFFGVPAFLTVSGQLEAETLACALGRSYTFGPTFRAENSNTTRHLAEFWMIEPELAFAGLDEDAALAEEFLKFLFQTALDGCAEDVAFFTQWVDHELRATLEAVVKAPFARMSYSEAITRLERSGENFEFPVSWGMDLQSEHERYLTEKHVRGPVIVTDFPKTIKPFYMRVNDDDRTVRAMDVLVPKVGELIGGSQREERLDVLERRLAECHMAAAPYWWYLDLRRYGTVPHAGFGAGFERLVQFATGMTNIRDISPYPRTPKHAEF